MSVERGIFLKVLKDSYSAYYDIAEDVQTELPLAFRADYRLRDERYWLTKKVPIWGNEKNEYAYIFSAPSFDSALAGACVEYAWTDGLPRVKPHKEHQYTNIKVILVADAWEQNVLEQLQREKRSKSYKFGLHGYSDLLLGGVVLSEQKTYTNQAGHELVPYFRKLFAARDEKT